MTKHLVPTLVAYAAAKRRAALKAEAQWSQQLPLERPDIRQYPGYYDPRLIRTADADDED
jgi:hypothetical protein